jgi:SAM-dependent methyltransferase
MRTYLRLKNRQSRKLPAEFQDQDLRYTEELVATFLRQYTRPGDVVLDPFAGYGTTLIAAEAMDRVPYGVEFDARRVDYIRSQVQQAANVIHGDSRQLLRYLIPTCDFSITSPPFMAQGDPEDPFTNYTVTGAGYVAYLRDLVRIYEQVGQLVKPGARVVLEVSNLKGPAGVTTLAWDVARELAAVLHFEGEVVIGWDTYGYGYDHSYCLVFSRRPD